MRRIFLALIVILALGTGTGCTLHTQPTQAPPPPDTAPYPQPSGPYVVLDRPDTVFYLLDYEIYYVPDIRDAVFFVEGTWYLHYDNRWYRGRSYSGPWIYMGKGELPPRLHKLPRDYRSKRYRKERVPYGHWTRPRPPNVRMDKPDYLYFLAGYGVYYVPSERHEIFYTDGNWYTRHRDTWFTSDSYRGPWAEIGPRRLPDGLRKLPRDYRNRSYEARRVPYGHWNRPRPPQIRIQKPEHMYLLAAYGVYYVPDERYEIFYTDGNWYTRHRDNWFVGDSYRGPWAEIGPRRLPDGLRKLPRDYRNRSYEARRVPYGHWNRPRPPQIRILKPEHLYILVTYGVYYVPDERYEIFYTDGGWYTRHQDNWFTGDSYRGPWQEVGPRRLPDGLRKLPRNYRDRSHNARRVPYGHWDREREKDVRSEREVPGPETRKGRDLIDKKPAPVLRQPPPQEPRDKVKTDQRPDKRDQSSRGKQRDRRDERLVKPDVLRYLEKQDIYFIPGIDREILYFRKAWYLRDEGKWFTGESYNGPWSEVDKRKVHKRLTGLPENYRTDKYPSREVPYGHWENRGKGKK